MRDEQAKAVALKVRRRDHDECIILNSKTSTKMHKDGRQYP